VGGEPCGWEEAGVGRRWQGGGGDLRRGGDSEPGNGLELGTERLGTGGQMTDQHKRFRGRGKG